jgi:Helix-turn-helix domain
MSTQEYGEFINNTQQGFTIVINKIINYELLSLKAKGLYLFIASKPTGWNFSLGGIASQNKESRDAIRTGIQELEKYGLLVRSQIKTTDGKFGGYRYTVTTNLIIEGLSPSLENPTLENPILENPILSNKEQSKKEKSNNNQLAKKIVEEKVVVNSENFKLENQIIEDFGIVGFGVERIKKFISEFGVERMNLVWLEYLDNQLKVKNPQGWLVSGLKNFDLRQQEVKIRLAAEAQKEALFAMEEEIMSKAQDEKEKALKIKIMGQIENWIKTHQQEFEICLQNALKKIQEIKPVYQSILNKAKQTGQDLIEIIKDNAVYSSWVFEEVKAVMN